MPTVRCPSCKTSQSIDASAHGYTCSSCGKRWGFVVCRSCGSRFHAKPDSATWRCPRCGLLQDASAEPPPPEIPEPEPAPASTATPRSVTISDADLDRPQQPSASAFPPGIGLGDDDEGPHDAFAMPYRESSRRPVWIWIVVGLVAAFGLAKLLAANMFGVVELDVPTFVVFAALLALVAVAAGTIPARRAMRVDPITALRAE